MEAKQIHSLRLRFAMAPVANPKSFCLDIKKTGEVEDWAYRCTFWPMAQN